MTTFLSFDTVFAQCSVAVNTTQRIACHSTPNARGQTEIILSMTDDLLQQHNIALSDIDVLVFNQGPGAFSGIRINTAVVQALSVATQALCVGVSSLFALAYCANSIHAFADDTLVASMMDARQNECYVGQFVIKGGQVIPIKEESLVAYEQSIVCDVAVGCGVDLLQLTSNKTAQPPTKLNDIKPSAGDLLVIGQMLYEQNGGVVAQNALPVYLRHNAWKTLAEQKSS